MLKLTDHEGRALYVRAEEIVTLEASAIKGETVIRFRSYGGVAVREPLQEILWAIERAQGCATDDVAARVEERSRA